MQEKSNKLFQNATRTVRLLLPVVSHCPGRLALRYVERAHVVAAVNVREVLAVVQRGVEGVPRGESVPAVGANTRPNPSNRRTCGCGGEAAAGRQTAASPGRPAPGTARRHPLRLPPRSPTLPPPVMERADKHKFSNNAEMCALVMSWGNVGQKNPW